MFPVPFTLKFYLVYTYYITPVQSNWSCKKWCKWYQSKQFQVFRWVGLSTRMSLDESVHRRFHYYFFDHKNAGTKKWSTKFSAFLAVIGYTCFKRVDKNQLKVYASAQLFSTYAFNANKFSLNVLSTFTAIYSHSIVNTNNFFAYFYQRKQISRKWHRITSDLLASNQ